MQRRSRRFLALGLGAMFAASTTASVPAAAAGTPAATSTPVPGAPVVVGTPDRGPNAAGWYRANVTIHWTATNPDPSGPAPTQPPDTIASTEGKSVAYASAPSCIGTTLCATGTLRISLDKTPPSGRIAVAGGAAWTASAIVSATSTASDTLSGIVSIGLSNDASRWATSAYAATKSWSLTEAQYGGTATFGARTVSAVWTDAAGNTSAVAQAKVRYEPYVRLAGRTRFATAVAVSAATFQAPVDVVYVAYAYNFPDALVGGAAAGTLHGPILLTAATGTLDAGTKAEIVRLKPKRIVVLGSEGVVGKDVFAQLTSLAPAVTRLGGADRFATSVAVSKAIFGQVPVDVAYVAYAYNYPDALVAAAAAGTLHGPILLADRAGPLRSAVRTELLRLKPRQIVVLGGADVVGSDVFKELQGISPIVTRYAGADRFATAAAVSKAIFTQAPVDVAYVAYAYDFPDALVGTAAAGTRKGPLFLSKTYGMLDAATTAELRRLQPRQIVVLGEPDVVSEPVAAQLIPFVASGAAEPPLPAYYLVDDEYKTLPHDDKGITLQTYTWGTEYNAVTISQAALAYCRAYQRSGLASDRAYFLLHADWLVANQTSDGLWLFTFEFGGQPIPWWSAMAEGQAISALVRAYRLTGDEKYATAAKKALATFTRPQTNRGVVEVASGYTWYEQYMKPYSRHTLNSQMFALEGLREYRLTFGDAQSADLYNKGLATLLHELPKFDTGTWSCYSFKIDGRCNGSTSKYHIIVIQELRYFYTLTGESILTRYADRFAAYLNGPHPA